MEKYKKYRVEKDIAKLIPKEFIFEQLGWKASSEVTIKYTSEYMIVECEITTVRIQHPYPEDIKTWLREYRGIHIEILLSDDDPYNTYYYRILKVGEYFTLSRDSFEDKDYDTVLCEALKLALESYI